MSQNYECSGVDGLINAAQSALGIAVLNMSILQKKAYSIIPIKVVL